MQASLQRIALRRRVPARLVRFFSTEGRPSRPVINRRLMVIVVVFLAILGTRLIRLSTLEMDRDEVWSVWQTFGTPAQIIAWTPYDWPPTYYLLVGGWRVLTGISPFTLRLMSLFTFFPGVAILYRIGLRLFNETAALLAIVACAAIGYVIHISIQVRAYSLIFTLTLLAWWLALRYFDHPSRRRGILLGISILALFYIHFSTIFPAAMIGLYTLVVYTRKIWRWWLPAVIVGVGIIPELILKGGLAAGRASDTMLILQQWLASGASIYRQNLVILMQNLGGYSFDLFAVFVLIAAFLIVGRYGIRRNTLGLLLWMAAPVVFFFAVLFDAFTERTFAWAVVGFALWIGWGMSRLPRSGVAGLVTVFFVIMIGPVPFAEKYKIVDTPLVQEFEFLSKHLQAGDVVLIDPNVVIAAEEWDYFTRAYFANGLQWVQQPQDYRRVWYFSPDGKPTTNVFNTIQNNRVAEDNLDVDGLMLQLYEQPPDMQGVLFDNGMRFNGAEILDQVGPIAIERPGEPLKLRLWWSVSNAVPLDYSVGTYIFSGSNMIAQFNGPPQTSDTPQQTSRWVSGKYYVEERDIPLPSQMISGTYNVLMAVYSSADGKRVSAPGTDANTLLPLPSFQIHGWSSAAG